MLRLAVGVEHEYGSCIPPEKGNGILCIPAFGWPWESNMSTAVASLFHCHAGGSRANKHACQRSQTRLCFRLVIFALNLIRISYCH